MRGVGLILVLLALLLIGILTIKELETETKIDNTPHQKRALIDQSKKAVQAAEASLERYTSEASKVNAND